MSTEVGIPLTMNLYKLEGGGGVKTEVLKKSKGNYASWKKLG
jgi:hypothetical protein